MDLVHVNEVMHCCKCNFIKNSTGKQGWSLWCVYGVHLLPVYNSDMCIGIKSKHPSQDEIKEVEGFLFAKQVASACGYNLFCGSVSSEQNPVIMQ